MLNLVVEHFGSLTATKLVKRTLQKNSNWYTIAKSKGLLDLFENRLTNSSDEKIDLTWYLDETTMRKSFSHRRMIIWEFHVAIKKQIINT